jgi:predicted transcriptional regulator
MKIKLDATDRKILEILQANSNITNAQLAQEIGLSPAPTLERVKTQAYSKATMQWWIWPVLVWVYVRL